MHGMLMGAPQGRMVQAMYLMTAIDGGPEDLRGVRRSCVCVGEFGVRMRMPSRCMSCSSPF